MSSWKNRWNRSVYGKAEVILKILFLVVLVRAIIENRHDFSSGGLLLLIIALLFEAGPLLLVLGVLILVVRFADTGTRQYRSMKSSAGDEEMSGLEKSRMKILLMTGVLFAAGVAAAVAARSSWPALAGLVIAALYNAVAGIFYAHDFSDKLTVRELQKVFRDVAYETTKSKEEAQQELSGLPFLVRGNRATMENPLSGALDTVRFRSADLRAYEITHHDLEDGGDDEALLGSFRVYTTEYRRPFEADAVVMDRKFIGGAPEKTGLPEVTFRSGRPEFDKRFRVWAKNAEEAEKALSSERIDAMVRIAERIPDRPCCFCMTGNQLHAVQNVPVENLLAPDAGKVSHTLADQVEDMTKEIAGMKEIVSWLSLFGEQG